MMGLFTQFAAGCSSGSFLGFPTWYKYLQTTLDTNGCSIRLSGVNDVWLVVAAIVEILLRIAAIAAVGFLLYGGFEYITSQAEPDKTNRAKSTIINALVGLVITILATVIINFVAGSIK